MPGAKKGTDLPAEQDIKYDKKLIKYIGFFKQDEIHQLAEDNDLLIDETKLEEGILKVLSFKTQKAVPAANLKTIKLYIAGINKQLKTKTIDISKVVKKESAERDNIKQVGHKYKVLVGLEDNYLCLTGEQKPVTEAVNEVKTLLGLGTAPHLYVNGNRRPNSAGSRNKGATGHSSGSKGNTGNSWTDGYPKFDADVQGLQIGPTAMGSPRQPPAGGYTHVRSGVHVMATVTDITQMTVDAVVNAANHKLRHGGGVALAIARAAGRDLLRESNAYIRKNGHLDVSETFVSTAGKMSAKKVIHTVGPQWGHNDAQISMQLLGATFYNVLQTADRDKLRTLAIPGISSGTYGMPLDLVAEIAVNSITQYLENTQKTVLTNIFLVGMDSSLISYIESHLDSYVHKGIYHSHSRPAPSGAVSNSPPVFPSRYQSPPSTHTEVFNLKDDMKDSRMNGRSSPQLNPTAQAMPQQYGSQVGALSNGGLQDDDGDEDDCCICMCPPINPKTLPKCKHTFCTDCIDRGFKIKPACPVCGEIYGEITGDQPKDGRMDVSRDRQQKLPGYERYGAIIIQYYFPGGIQTKDMASPGQSYSGTHRTAFLPDNAEGNKVLKLLERAFKARLIFTVGRSRTTGADNTVTWNDIHHKTNTHGGTQRFGYPDPTYLDRVQDELAAKGIK